MSLRHYTSDYVPIDPTDVTFTLHLHSGDAYYTESVQVGREGETLGAAAPNSSFLVAFQFLFNSFLARLKKGLLD